MKIFKEKRNTIVLVSAVFSILIFNSCVNLDPDPVEFDLPPGTYGSVGDLDNAIIGVYGQLTNAAKWTTFHAPSWAGDDITTHRESNKADFREFDQRNVASANGRLLNNWDAVFNIVNTANSILERSEGLVDLGVDPEKVNRLIGEVYFLRGLAFFHAARVHGKIPLPLTRLPDPNIGLSEVSEVFAQIEADFLEAESRLPDVYPGVMPGAVRPNKGSAQSLLSRLYMHWAGFPLKDTSKYTDAANKAKEVIDNSGAYSFGLMDDLEDLWKLENRFNNESVFTMSYCGDCGFATANLKNSILGLPGDFDGWQETFAEVRFFEDFPEGARKEATYRTDLDWENFVDQKNPVFKKVAGPEGDLPSGAFMTGRSDFYMRYAEVLLIYAEASGRSGNVTPESWEALNKIRRRASGLPYDTPDAGVDITTGDIAELAFEERKWEFAGEYLRWFDLVRMERVEEALTRRDEPGIINESNAIIGSLGTDNYFSPIPAAAIEANPNLAN